MKNTDKNKEIARKAKNFVKNIRRDVVAKQKTQSAETSTQYEKRRALAAKVATKRVVTSVETILDGNPTDSVIAKGILGLRDELTAKVSELNATKTNPDTSQYHKRRARGEEVATASALSRVEKLVA